MAKYNFNCDEVWIRIINSGSGDGAFDVAVDAADNIYVSGWTNGVLFGSNAGSSDAWLAKYDTSGNQQWVRQYGTAEQDRARGIAFDSNNNIVVAGRTAGFNGADGSNAWLAK